MPNIVFYAKIVLDLFFPVHCLGCNKEGQFICFSCFKKIPLNKKSFVKSNQKNALNGLITASYYEHALVKQAIHRYKYDFVRNLAKPLGQLMIKKLTNFYNVFNKDNSVLIPVPLHPKRLRWRGFNQAELLALEVGQELNIPVINDILIRTKHALPQVKIKNSLERKENVKQTFQLNKQLPPNKIIILVDDISTTGATLKECAQALFPLKPKQIWGLVLAQG